MSSSSSSSSTSSTSINNNNNLNQTPPPTPPSDPSWFPNVSVNQIEDVVGSCPFKATTSGVLGGGLGFLFGAFFAGAGNLDHLRPDAPKKSTWVQVKEGFRHSATRGKSMARGFALAGGVYVGCECLIEKRRGKSDIWNAIMGGCAAGAALSAKGGPQAMALGCAGFAAFSTVIELVMIEH
eukprot:CAMPEP_0168584414 /NCGR_PEP_ID=MMETSP0420-20121227/3124_1 /TAXON_ID=498008 /ORGANISM="Pessonella sp." /LENGTH=180 /DNA_ID=CAMNT_0008619209 /DNA_START=867 /DNA_END=1409 /DNA_ORIENTATION=-